MNSLCHSLIKFGYQQQLLLTWVHNTFTHLPVLFNSRGIFQDSSCLAAQNALGARERRNNCQQRETKKRETKKEKENRDKERKEQKYGEIRRVN